MIFEEILEAMDAVGPYNALVACGIFVFSLMLWREWRRMDRLEARLETEAKYRVDVLVPLLKECKDALKENTNIIERNTRIVEQLLKEKLP